MHEVELKCSKLCFTFSQSPFPPPSCAGQEEETEDYRQAGESVLQDEECNEQDVSEDPGADEDVKYIFKMKTTSSSSQKRK